MIRKLKNISLADCLTLLYIYTLFLLMEFGFRFFSFSTMVKLVSFKNSPIPLTRGGARGLLSPYQRGTKGVVPFAKGGTLERKQFGIASGPYPRRDPYLVAVASRYNFLKVTCLSRSFVLLCLLRRRGLVPVLYVGVQKGEIFNAHAWVEVEGRPILDSELGISGFSRILELT